MGQVVRAICAVAFAGVAMTDAPLPQRVLSTTTDIGDHVIVGRSRCGSSTWLLTDAPELLEVKRSEWSVVRRPVRGLGRDEHLWGLACVGGVAAAGVDELWTLADARTLARLSSSGELMSRTKLRQPRLNVFGVGEWLLLQRAPGGIGRPLLDATHVADVSRTTPWPGPITRTMAPTKLDVPSGLVACGLGADKKLPCWITNQTRITVSDGTPSHTFEVQPKFITSTAVDPNVPLWDVAIASSTLWVLTSAASGEDARRTGARLTKSNLRGDDVGAADVKPRARVIVSATDRIAVVLTTAGGLVEVGTP
jgi:hypothetical protein